MPSCRIIANCESLSKVILPLRSRCLQVRVPAPKETEISEILRKIATKESFELPVALAMSIAKQSRRNMRRAIMMLQTVKVKNQSLSGNILVPKPDFEGFIGEIANDVMFDQSP